MTPREKAELLIKCIQNELSLGTRHTTATFPYRKLETVREILVALTNDGSVIIEPIPERQHLFISYNDIL